MSVMSVFFVFLCYLCYNNTVIRQVFLLMKGRIILRIIAGSAKKRLLKVPVGWTGRPTADKVKESLFNILGGMLVGSRFLDLFAGTGNVGIEALSRGALKAVFVEKDSRAICAIMHNLKATGFENSSRVMVGNVIHALTELGKKGVLFDIVFMDPPYGMGIEIAVIEKVHEMNILTSDGLLVVESGKRETLPSGVMGLSLTRQVRYGDTMLSFYEYSGRGCG